MLKKYIGSRAFYMSTLAIAVPILLQNGITNFVSMLDNIMVGRIGTVQMTGVAVSNQLVFVFSLCLFGAVSGAGIFGAQFYGKGDNEGLKYCFRFKLVFCTLMTAVCIGVFLLYGSPLINMYLRGSDSEVDAAAALKEAKDYLLVILFGLFPYSLVQCYSSALRETGETMLPMKAGATAVCVNLLLNYVLIYPHFGLFGYGVRGAAIATVTSRFVELAIVVVWTHRHKKRNAFIIGAYRSLKIPLKLAGKMLASGAPLTANETAWAAGVAMINQCYSVRGLDVVAAVNISQTFWNVFSVVYMAVGTAIGIIIGQMLGAERFDEVHDTNRKLITLSLAISVAVGLVYAASAKVIPGIYNTTDGVRSLAEGLMIIGACTMPINAFTHASYFTLRSGGKTLITFLFDSCYIWAISLPLAYVLSRYTAMPILTLFLCVQLIDIVKCIIGYVLLKKGIWINNITYNLT